MIFSGLKWKVVCASDERAPLPFPSCFHDVQVFRAPKSRRAQKGLPCADSHESTVQHRLSALYLVMGGVTQRTPTRCH